MPKDLKAHRRSVYQNNQDEVHANFCQKMFATKSFSKAVNKALEFIYNLKNN